MTLEIDVSAAFTAEGATRFEVEADLSVRDGETLVVLGPSGSGKSLLLETVAGFHDHEGTVALDEQDLTDAPPEERGLSFVFQDYALFPHATVRENVAFGGRYHEIRDPDDLLAEFGVADLTDRYPPTLSGGERQRVALARAVAVQPEAFLLDEPLSALDVPTRQTLREVLADVLAEETAMYVTHNRTTARMLADRVAVIRDGDIVQTGTPEAVFECPDTSFVARFTGSNCLEISDGLLTVPGGQLEFEGDSGSYLTIRPEHVALDPADPDFTAPIERVLWENGRCRLALDVAGQRLDAYAPAPRPEPPESEGEGEGKREEEAELAHETPTDSVGVSLPREDVTVLSR